MNAKDLALMINVVDDEYKMEAIKTAFQDLMSSLESLMQGRRLKSGSMSYGAIHGCIREINDKWQAVARQCKYVKADGFLEFMKEKIPVMYEIYESKGGDEE